MNNFIAKIAGMIANRNSNQVVTTTTTLITAPVVIREYKIGYVAPQPKPVAPQPNPTRIIRVSEIAVGKEIVGITGGTKNDPITARFIITEIKVDGYLQFDIRLGEAFGKNVRIGVKEILNPNNANEHRISLAEFIQWTRPCQNGRWA